MTETTVTQQPGTAPKIRIASAPGGAMGAFLHPACAAGLEGVEYHDLTIAELVDNDIVTCDRCGERIVPRGVSKDPTKHTPGPWQWCGNLKNRDIYLATVGRGTRLVMGFARYGMSSAQPRFQVAGRMVDASELAVKEVDYRADIANINHPDANLIVAAPDLYEALAMVRDADDDCHRDGLPTMPTAARAKVDAALAKVERRS